MNKITWQSLGFVAVAGATIVALAALTDWESAEIIAIGGLLLGIGSGAAVAGSVAGRVDAVHNETAAQTTQLHAIERRVNGELDIRIEDGARRAATTVLAELRAQGVIR